MIDGVRILLIHSTVAAVAVGNMVPFGRAGEADGPIVLCSRHQPFRRVGIARHILDFRDGETFVERGPAAPTVSGPIDTAVVACINDLGVAGCGGEAVLVGWMLLAPCVVIFVQLHVEPERSPRSVSIAPM